MSFIEGWNVGCNNSYLMPPLHYNSTRFNATQNNNIKFVYRTRNKLLAAPNHHVVRYYILGERHSSDSHQ